jgi:hypothetical protein
LSFDFHVAALDITNAKKAQAFLAEPLAITLVHASDEIHIAD